MTAFKLRGHLIPPHTLYLLEASMTVWAVWIFEAIFNYSKWCVKTIGHLIWVFFFHCEMLKLRMIFRDILIWVSQTGIQLLFQLEQLHTESLKCDMQINFFLCKLRSFEWTRNRTSFLKETETGFLFKYINRCSR